jgi:hypothetical protein
MSRSLRQVACVLLIVLGVEAVPLWSFLQSVGPALFHEDYPWRRRYNHPIMQIVGYVRDHTPPSARIYVFRMGDFAFYSQRRLLVDLDPTLVPLYEMTDTHKAYAFLREKGVDYICPPGYDYPTFHNSVVADLVADPTLCELITDIEGWRLYRLLPPSPSKAPSRGSD